MADNRPVASIVSEQSIQNVIISALQNLGLVVNKTKLCANLNMADIFSYVDGYDEKAVGNGIPEPFHATPAFSPEQVSQELHQIRSTVLWVVTAAIPNKDQRKATMSLVEAAFVQTHNRNIDALQRKLDRLNEEFSDCAYLSYLPQEMTP